MAKNPVAIQPETKSILRVLVYRPGRHTKIAELHSYLLENMPFDVELPQWGKSVGLQCYLRWSGHCKLIADFGSILHR